jgi:NAD(P)-dependent dehydrogenase (short-subunit alcohol dehydrogenase family)
MSEMTDATDGLAWLGAVLRGRRALVTGAASGIGRGIAGEFRRAGADVVGVDIVGECDLRCDVSSERDVVDAFADCARGGAITDVVHAAAVAGYGVIEEMDLDRWQRVVDVNLTGSFLVAREAVRRMASGGVITIISSQSGVRGGAGRGAYSATKHGVIGLAESLAREVGQRGIRVNTVLPYAVDTPMAAETLRRMEAETGIDAAQLRRTEEQRIALGRSATPDEIARVCIWLASDLASYVTGSSITVDGAAN